MNLLSQRLMFPVLFIGSFFAIQEVTFGQGPKIDLPKIELKGELYKLQELPKSPEVKSPPVIAEPISAPVQVWLAAQPSKEVQIALLKSEALGELEELRFHQWQVFFQGLTSILTREQSSSTEDEFREARAHFIKYLDLLKQIEELTGEQAEAERRYNERLKNLTVFPSGGYSVQNSDSAVITRYYPENPPRASSDEQPMQQSKGTHWEDRCGVEKCLIKAGFDKNGSPYYRMGYDVVRKKVEVPNK
ncbi:MAG: hypothetical protein WC600_08620 [Desulfobaccales bacterium]